MYSVGVMSTLGQILEVTIHSGTRWRIWMYYIYYSVLVLMFLKYVLSHIIIGNLRLKRSCWKTPLVWVLLPQVSHRTTTAVINGIVNPTPLLTIFQMTHVSWPLSQSSLKKGVCLKMFCLVRSRAFSFRPVILRWAAVSNLLYKDLISCLYTTNLGILCLIKTLQHQMPSVATCCVLLPRELMLCDKPYFPNQ